VPLLLLQASADVNRTDRHGGSALRYACVSGHAALTQLLLEHDADIGYHSVGNIDTTGSSTSTGTHNSTCLMLACSDRQSFPAAVVILEYYIQRYNISDNDDDSSININNNNDDDNDDNNIIDIVNATNEFGWTAMMMAMKAATATATSAVSSFHAKNSLTSLTSVTCLLLQARADPSIYAHTHDNDDDDNDGRDEYTAISILQSYIKNNNDDFNNNNINDISSCLNLLHKFIDERDSKMMTNPIIK
jgi:hypothetical protein